MLTFRVLGPLEVRNGERVVELPPGKQRLLLGALLLRAGEIVAADTLIEELWGEGPPRTARGALVNNVSQLRKALEPDVLLTRAPGYLLDVSAEQTDLGQFERLTAEARATESVAERGEKLREALALWRGPPFADLAYESFAQLEISRLEDLRLATRQDLIDAELELGNHADLLPELEVLVQQQPFDERLRGQQILALYRAGRQADALEAYQTTRRLLDDELGLEPGTELRDLEQSILRQDPALTLANAPPAKTQPSRRTVTVLFADLVDSTALAERLDPEALQAVLNRYFAAMREAIERHGGTVEKFIGDAVMAVFGVPKAHEDDALRAVRAAVDIHHALSAVEGGLQARIGVNTGEVYTGSETALVTGSTVSLAKRLEQAAPAGEILAGASTLRLVRDAVRAEPAEPLHLGNSQALAVRIVEVEQGKPALAPRLDVPLVGRQEEVARLRREYARARAEQSCRMVTVLGEAGIGKTRLAQELIRSVSGEATVLVGRCASYGEGATYLPLGEMIADVSALISEATSSGEVAVAIRERFEAMARAQPVVLVFEDLHWAEPALLDLIVHLDQWAEGPILGLCLSRPEWPERRASPLELTIELKPLSDEDAASLVVSLEASVGPGLRARIVEISEGNPLFAEQLVAYAHEEALTSIAVVPPSIEALIASRLDLLETEARALLQRLSVIGRVFTREAAEALGSLEALPVLESTGLVHSIDQEFRFHHVLIRDVAYAGIPKHDRAGLHERAAMWLEDQPAVPNELVGYHLEQAYHCLKELRDRDGELLEIGRNGARYLAAGGRAAMGRGDPPAAVNLLSRALTLVTEDDDRAEISCDLADAQRDLGDLVTAGATVEEAIASAAASRNDVLEWRARLFKLALVHHTQTARSDEAAAEATLGARKALQVFEKAGDERGIAQALHLMTWGAWNEGRLGEAARMLAQALDHASNCTDDRRAQRLIRFDLFSALLVGPAPLDDVISYGEAALAWSRERGNRLLEAQMILGLGFAVAMGGEVEQGRALVARGVRAQEDLGPLQRHGSKAAEAEFELLIGNAAAAAELARRCYESGEADRRMFIPRVLFLLAQSLSQLGQCDEAVRFAWSGQEEMLCGDVLYEIDFRRALANPLAQLGHSEEAVALAREAVTLAEATDCTDTHANCLIDLGGILLHAEQPAEATPLVAKAIRLSNQKGSVLTARRAGALRKQLAVRA